MPKRRSEKVQRIQDEVLTLGNRVEHVLIEAVEALRARDLDKAREIIDNDRLINETRFAIEHDVLVLMATQQPAASDLRTLAAVLEIITELERIGDYGKGISKISLMLGENPLLKPLIDIRDDGKAVSMIHGAHRLCRAGCDRPWPRARTTRWEQLKPGLPGLVTSSPTPGAGPGNYLMGGAQHQRAADRSTNLCARGVHGTGKMTELDTHEEVTTGPRA